MQQALVIIKPDGVQRRLIGKILQKIEEKGLLVVGLKMMVIPEKMASANYVEHEGKPFYKALIHYMTSGPSVIMVLYGMSAICVARKLIGSTFGRDAEPGTIRGDFAISKRFNIVHCSDSPESAENEINLFFTKEELLDHKTIDLNWIYDSSEGNYV